MRRMLLAGVALALFPPLPADAAQSPPAGTRAPAQTAPRTAPADGDIVVRGSRQRTSNWRIAETDHVVVLSDGTESELIRYARNLETLHALLSRLTGRDANAADPTVPLQVTMIGDLVAFQGMDLRNTRWQQGPFSARFQKERYYDPREDGAVMATTRSEQRIEVEQGPSFGQIIPSLPQPEPGDFTAFDPGALLGLADDAALQPTVGDGAVAVAPEELLYAGFAQHWLMTYYPAAYPRWYLDGFGQLFSTLKVQNARTIEYGRAPDMVGKVFNRLGGYPVAHVLDGRYLSGGANTRWTPAHAWLLTHYLFFDDARRPQFRRYLAALSNGASQEDAAAQAFGDPKTLAAEVRRYHGQRKPWFRVALPEAWAEEPVVRRLNEAQAAFVQGRLELGGRVDLPPEAPAGTEPADGAKFAARRADAVAARDRWLARLRGDAARYPAEPTAQLLLAEAECRSGNAAECEAAADRALAIEPTRVEALAWKGIAQTMRAAALPPEQRGPAIAAARATIGRANRADNDAVLPLLAYARTFLDTGTPPPPLAVAALDRAVTSVPAAPASRLRLARALVDTGDPQAARAVLMPVAAGPYDSPERAPARAMTTGLPATPAPPQGPPPAEATAN